MAKSEVDLTNEVKRLWGGFLIDLNVQDTIALLGKKARITSYQQDDQTVHEAWEESRTIVTCNEADFVRFIIAHSKRDSGRRCQDCWGLLIVPSSQIARSRVIKKAKNGIPVDGNIVPWSLIGFANLCISLHADGTLGARRFRRCDHCQKRNRIESEWYEHLPELGARNPRV